MQKPVHVARRPEERSYARYRTARRPGARSVPLRHTGPFYGRGASPFASLSASHAPHVISCQASLVAVVFPNRLGVYSPGERWPHYIGWGLRCGGILSLPLGTAGRYIFASRQLQWAVLRACAEWSNLAGPKNMLEGITSLRR